MFFLKSVVVAGLGFGLCAVTIPLIPIIGPHAALGVGAVGFAMATGGAGCAAGAVVWAVS
jgi:hypothetical protein